MANTAARLLYFHLQHKNKSIVDLLAHTLKRTFLSVWICLDQMKRKATDEKENENNDKNNKNQVYLRNHTV